MTTPVTTRQSPPDTTQKPLPAHDKADEKSAPVTTQQSLPDHDEDDEKTQPVVFHLNNTDIARFDDDNN